MSDMQLERPAIEWGQIEAQYRAGIISVRAIGVQFGVSETAIRKHAKKHGWQRDLTDIVREVAREKMLRIDAAEAGTAPAAECSTAEGVARLEPVDGSEQAIVEGAAEIIVAVVREHRSAIKRGRALIEKLISRLDEVSDNQAEIERDIEQLTKDDRDGKRRARLLRAVATPTQANAVLSLSAAMKNVLALERQAFNVSDSLPPEELSQQTVIILPPNGR